MKPSSPSPASQRRLIERLSGWRLYAFFISATLNLGFLAGLILMPLFVNPARIFFVTAWVSASHCVFLIAVAGFRFPISVKIALGLAHATACLFALASVEALPWAQLVGLDVSTLYLIPMLTFLITIGGVAIARLTGFHRSKRFSIADVMLLVTAFAIMLPLILGLLPHAYFTEGISIGSLKSTFAVAATTGLTSLVISNLYLSFIPTGKQGLSPWMLFIGWFLFVAMIDWNVCQFSVVAGLWVLVSLIPIYGIARQVTDHRQSEFLEQD